MTRREQRIFLLKLLPWCSHFRESFAKTGFIFVGGGGCWHGLLRGFQSVVHLQYSEVQYIAVEIPSSDKDSSLESEDEPLR